MTANASRLRARIDSVRCEVHVVRDDFQAEALDKMKQKMAELISAIETETEGATEKLQLYINCCSREEGQVLVMLCGIFSIKIDLSSGFLSFDGNFSFSLEIHSSKYKIEDLKIMMSPIIRGIKISGQGLFVRASFALLRF